MSADVRARVAMTWVPFAATLALAGDRRVRRWEHAATRRVNRLPEVLHVPMWTVMQTGTAGAPLVAAGGAVLARRPALGLRLAACGLSAYVIAKVVKRAVRRGRPAQFVPGLSIRGRPATGDGYVSGHAAVSMALAVETAAELDGVARSLPLVGAIVVALSRVYVGAHLPLDVVGGAALGWAISRTEQDLRTRWNCRHFRQEDTSWSSA